MNFWKIKMVQIRYLDFKKILNTCNWILSKSAKILKSSNTSKKAHAKKQEQAWCRKNLTSSWTKIFGYIFCSGKFLTETIITSTNLLYQGRIFLNINRNYLIQMCPTQPNLFWWNSLRPESVKWCQMYQNSHNLDIFLLSNCFIVDSYV